MPAYRNVDPSRLFGESGTPISPVYTEGSSPESIFPPLPYQNIKIEYLAGPDSLIPFSPSSSCSPPVSPPFTASSHNVKPRRSHGRTGDPNHVSRPCNAFIVFRSHYVKRLVNLEDHQNELSKGAAKVWNRMSAQEKLPFVQEALREKEEHYRLYPNYVYAPKSNGVKSKRTTRKTARKPKASAPRALLPETAFVSTYDIPALELSPRYGEVFSPQCKETEHTPEFALDPSPFHPHIDVVPSQFGFHQYTYDDVDPTMPVFLGETMHESYGYPTYDPAMYLPECGSSLLCANPYPSADYLAASQSPSYSFEADAAASSYDLFSPPQTDEFVDTSAFVNQDWFHGTQA